MALLIKQRDEKASKSEDWSAKVVKSGEISLSVTTIDIADFGFPENSTKVRVALTPENVHRLFQSCDRMIAPGEGLESAFWKKVHDPAEPDRAKLELYALLRDPNTIGAIEKLANERFTVLERNSRSKVNELPEAKRIRYRECH